MSPFKPLTADERAYLGYGSETDSEYIDGKRQRDSARSNLGMDKTQLTKRDIVDELDRLADDILREEGALASGSPSECGYADMLFKRALANAWPEIRARLKAEEAALADRRAHRSQLLLAVDAARSVFSEDGVRDVVSAFTQFHVFAECVADMDARGEEATKKR